jgi:hypothetical protein
MELVQAFRKVGAFTTNTLKQALIFVEHDGIADAILDHALGDGRQHPSLREADRPRYSLRNLQWLQQGRGRLQGRAFGHD